MNVFEMSCLRLMRQNEIENIKTGCGLKYWLSEGESIGHELALSRGGE